jgi:hypothetical protein
MVELLSAANLHHPRAVVVRVVPGEFLVPQQLRKQVVLVFFGKR